jgi:hypothetical protein
MNGRNDWHDLERPGRRLKCGHVSRYGSRVGIEHDCDPFEPKRDSMALTAVAAIPPESPSHDPEPYRHAGVFISYASKDHDIAQAVYQSLQALGETIFDRIKVFLDSKSIDGGDEIRADIREGLKNRIFSWSSIGFRRRCRIAKISSASATGGERRSLRKSFLR